MTERVIDAVFDSVFIADLAGDIKEVNEACCRTLGYGREALLGMHVSSILRQGEVSEILGLAHGERKRGLRLNLRAADGVLVPVEVNAHRCIHSGREAVFCAARERAGHTRTEGETGQGGETYRTVFEELGDGYWETDLAGRLTFVNGAMCRMAEATREELLSGVNFSDYADPETKKRIYRIFEEVYRTGNPAAVGDYEVTRRDGSTGVFQFNVSLIRDEGGQPVGFRGITRDVTGYRAMQKALQESEERHRNILESIADGYWEVDLEGRFTFFNDALCRMVGLAPEELKGLKGLEYTVPGTAKRVYEVFNEIYRTGKRADIVDYTFTKPSGGTETHELSVSLMRDPEGRPVGFREIARDVTERRAMERALQESEESYRNVLELAPDSIAIVRREDARYLQVNDAFCLKTGYSAEEVIGKTSRELNLYVDPAARKRLFHILAREGRIDGIEIQYQTKDGAVLDDLLSARTIRFRGEECFLIVATTITSLRRAQEALRRSEEKYRTILKNMEEGYYETDRAGRLTFFNDAMCRMLGFSRKELMGMDYRRYTAPEAAERIFGTFNEVWRTGKPAEDVVQEIVKKDGTGATHEMSVSLMKDAMGTPVGFRGVVRDVTLRKRAEKEIQTHREHLALINQILRHDLTNDLVVMQSALNLYKISREGELLDETTGRIRKSLKLIDRMKQLESFISSHKDLQAYKIRDIVREVAESYPFIAVEIKGKAQVMADDSLISVIDNIVRNAVIHGKANEIAVTIGVEEGMCEVRIADNGSGIADEIKETIFEEGYRYGDTGHTGIGLHIVKKAMEKYGGYVYVEDNEPRGTAFVLMFRAI